MIAGYGKSGISAEKLLKNYTSKIDIYTDEKKNIDFHNYQLIVTSPGFKPNHQIYQNKKFIFAGFHFL